MATGFTLVEVVIGLSLMASVVVASLLAFSGHRKQIRQANGPTACQILYTTLPLLIIIQYLLFK